MFPMAYGLWPACSPQLHRPLCGLRVLFAFFAGCRGFQFLFSGPASEISFSVYAAPGRIKSRGVAGSVQGKKIFCSFQYCWGKLTVES